MSIDSTPPNPNLEAILNRISGKALDPALHRYFREEAARIREELRKKYGVVNFAIDLIRDARSGCG